MILTGVEKKLGNFSLCIEKLVIPGPGIYGLAGPNGSGKSTLARLMTGLLEPDRGSIDTGGLGPRDITLLPHKPYMMDDTVYNNLVYPLKLRNIKPEPRLIAGYLERMGLAGRGKQKARSLSGGEQQKLAFFRALIFRPRLIIADEAMTALDIDSLDLFEQMILEEQKKDPVIWIIISHEMTHVRRLVNHLFFMYQGSIGAEGNMGEMQSLAANPHFRQYLRLYGGGE
ncbi:MAG: ABC transporter ATP-binding protein [Treponema sp.]|nr:ABC transporter ATP-binding protein [Treponema sp.]